MDLETKCPHCDQWTASNVESCSKCGGLLVESKEGANPFISTLKKNWRLATGLAGAVLVYMLATRLIPVMNMWEQKELLLYEIHKPFHRIEVKVLGKPE